MRLRPLFLLLFVIIVNIIFGQASANFTADDLNGCTPFALQLNDNSTSNTNIVSWNWTMDGDFLSNQQNPASLLNTPGFYSICLTITDALGNSDTECKTDFIQVFESPTAQFSADQTSGCIPLTVNFSNNSTLGSSPLDQVTWDFGGSCGVIIAEPDEVVACNYEGPGSFQVSMIVMDENGCQGNINIADFITANPLPEITAVVPDYDNCEAPFSVDFGNAGPNNPDITYQWDFGNGQSFIGVNPDPIIYSDAGPYNIQITAINQVTGCQDSLLLENAIEESNPIEFSFSRVDNCAVPEVIFTDESIGSADIVSWDFGDGNTSQLVNPIHDYGAFGCYTVIFTRTVGDCTKSISQEICLIEVSPPTVNANALNTAGCNLPHLTSFSLSANLELNYLWDFGDGNTSTELNPSHIYDNYGDYPVSLLVTDQLGCESFITVDTIRVQPLSLTLGSAGQQGCSPLSVDFDPQINSISPVLNYAWTITDNNGAIIFQSNAVAPSFTFNNLGCYNVSVLINNQEGCQFSQTFDDVYCVGSQPSPAFSVDPLIGCASQEFSFQDNSTGNVNYWQWDFESDGTIDNFEQNPTYSYNDLGCFDATLIVSNFGCSASTAVGPICIEPPVSKFEVAVDCDNPTRVTFTNNSEGADSVIWDFGVMGVDNDTSTAFSPTFNYPALGTYTTTLITYNFTTDCSDTLELETVLAIPEANFSIDTLNYCRPAIIYPTNNSIGASSYLWTLPDGGSINNTTTATPTIIFNESGYYSIHLEILNANNCASEYLIENIRVSGPEVGFDFNVSQSCVPFLTEFIDTSTNDLSENISWTWNIEELNLTANEQFPSLELDTAGVFTVSLTVEDIDGCQDVVEKSIGLNEGAPVAYFSGDLYGCQGIINEFQDLSIGNNINYEWNFGDGGQSSLQNPSHEFALGEYEVCLTINDANCIDTHCELVQIQEVIAAFEVDDSYISCAPAPVVFINNSENAQDYFWNYGDGTGSVQIDQASHIYNSTGVYDVELIAVGNNPDCLDTLLIPEAVSMTGPQATFSYSMDDFCVPAELSVQIESDRRYKFLVFYDDGNSIEIDSSGMFNFIHEYTTATRDGFIPSLLIIEDEGCEELVEGTDTIRLSALEIDLDADRNIICDDDRSVVFESIVTSSESEYLINWEFENGNPATSEQSDLSVNFEEVGSHSVSLTVSNANCEESINLDEFIEVFEIATLTAPSFEICLGDTVFLSSDGNTDYVNWTPLEFLEDASGDNPLADSYMVIPNESMTFTASGAIGPCPETTAESEIIVNALPTIEMENFYIYFPGESFEIGPTPNDQLEYYWYPNYLIDCSYCANPTFSGDSTGTFRLRVTDPETTCYAEDIVQVRQYSKCPDNTFYIPNVFSPNGDGENEEFKIEYSLLDNIIALHIFDRWGNKLWETDDLTQGWDGRFRGQPMQSGVYVFKIEALCSIDGRIYTQHGDVTLLR